MRGYSICLFINLFVCLAAKSQETYSDTTTNKLPLTKNSPEKCSAFSISRPADIPVKQDNINSIINTIPASFYLSTIGFFCKKELQIEKTLKFPVKFRLGSVEYTDKLEGKGTGTLYRNK